MKLLRYLAQTLLVVLAMQFMACSPEKDPQLIESMQMEIDSVQADYDRIANAKQRLGAIMQSLQSLAPEMLAANKTVLDSFQLKINSAIDDFRNLDLSEADKINEMKADLAAYGAGTLKKAEVKAKFEAFQSAVSGLQSKADKMDAGIQTLETEMLNLLPTDFKEAGPATGAQSVQEMRNTGTGSNPQPVQSGDAGTPTLVQPKKQ